MSCEINFQVLNHLPVCKVRPAAAVQLTVLPLLIRKLYRQLVPEVWLSETISMSLFFEQCGCTFSVGRPAPTPVSETAVLQSVVLQGTTINSLSCTMLAQKQANIIHTIVCVRSDQINVYLLGLLLKCKLDSRNKNKKNKKNNYLYQYRWNTLQVWGNFNSVLKAVAVTCSRGLVFCNKSNESVWFQFKHFHRCSPSLEMSIAHRSHLILKQTMPDTQLPNTYLVHIINRMCIFLNSMYCVMLIPN